MELPLWGDLPKSQIDPQLITEYVSQAIAAHEADPEAHLGSGESLEQHKSNPVVDHPVGSILADKQSLSEWIFNTVFESIDAWSATGEANVGDLSGLQLYVEYGPVNASGISSNPNFVPDFFNSDFDMMFQTLGRWQGSNLHLNGYFGFLNNSTSGTDGFGFQLRDGALYAHVRCGTTTVDQLLSGVDITLPHIYRAQYTESLNSIDFYIDGAVVFSTTRPTGTTWNDDRGPALKMTLTQSNDGIFYFGSLSVARALYQN